MTKKLFLLLFTAFFVSYSFSSELDSLNQKVETLHDVKHSFKDFRVSVGGGYARRLGEKDNMDISTLNQLLNKVQNETYLEIDAQYFFKETWGIGLTINNAFGSGEVDRVKLNTNLFYIGPTYSMRFDFDKFLLVWNIGIGPLFYNEKLSGFANDKFDKVTFGFQTNFGAEYKLNQQLGLGVKLGWVSGSYVIKDANNEDYTMNLSNFNVGAYLSFRTW